MGVGSSSSSKSFNKGWLYTITYNKGWTNLNKDEETPRVLPTQGSRRYRLKNIPTS